MFKETNKDLGTLKVGQETTVTFAFEDISTITKLVSPCDCTTPFPDMKSSVVKIKYKPKPVPEHLKLQGRTGYKTEKKTEVYYLTKSGESVKETITFTANIHG